MRPGTSVHALFHGYCCYNQSIIRKEFCTKEKNSLYGTNIQVDEVLGSMFFPETLVFIYKAET
jgi:hypothetical protein